MVTAIPTWAEPRTPDRVVFGQVTTDSRPEAGVHLDLVAWPSEGTLAALPSGSAVSLLQVGTADTDAAGRFAIVSNAGLLPSSYKDADGTVDFALVATSSDWSLRLDFSAKRDARSTGAATWLSRGAVAQARFDFGQDAGVGLVSDDASRWVTGDAGAGADLTAAGLLRQRPSRASGSTARLVLDQVTGTVTPEAPGPCYEVPGAWTYGVSEYFIKAYGWSGAKVTLTQGVGATHALGVAGAVAGGSFKQTGTANFGVTSSVDGSVPGVVDATAYNLVNYRTYSNSCTGYQVKRATSWNSILDHFTYAPHVNFATCSGVLYPGSVYSKTNGTNVTYGAGVSLGPISLSAQSGHTTTSKESWVITANSRLCGSQSAGWASSAQASAKAA